MILEVNDHLFRKSLSSLNKNLKLSNIAFVTSSFNNAVKKMLKYLAHIFCKSILMAIQN